MLPPPCSAPCVAASSAFFWFLFASLRIIQHVLWSRRTKQKAQTQSSTNLHTAHSERMQRPRAQQNDNNNNNNNKTKEGSRFVFVEHLSSAGETVQEEEASKRNQLVLHRRTSYTFAVHANSMNNPFFCPFSIKTHTDVHHKKGFSFLQNSSVSLWSVRSA